MEEKINNAYVKLLKALDEHEIYWSKNSSKELLQNIGDSKNVIEQLEKIENMLLGNRKLFK